MFAYPPSSMIGSLLVSPRRRAQQNSAVRPIARRIEDKMDAFTQDLPRRIQHARRDPAQLDYALYVYCRRLQLGLTRAQLAEQSGIAPAQLAFLENGWLLTGEPTQEEQQRLETILGISYTAFMAHATNRRLVAQVKRLKFGESVRDWLRHALARLAPRGLATLRS